MYPSEQEPAGTPRIRALVVEDSAFFRGRVMRILNSDPELEVVGFAVDGREAIEKVRALRPHVVTMDVEMPVMDGIAAVREIMRSDPTCIVMLSAHTQAGAEATFNALEAGAADFITKQALAPGAGPDDGAGLLLQRIKSLMRRQQRRSRAPLIHRDTGEAPVGPVPDQATGSGIAGKSLLVIGASTGGPALLNKLFAAVDAPFPCPVLIVQHMPATFTRCYAERLDRICPLPVAEAAHGDRLRPGCILIAPGGKQTLVRNDAGRLLIEVRDPLPAEVFKPSVDVTFASVAAACGRSALALVLTGMGSDGCAGGRELFARGAEIWAQDEASSVVFGMPAAVIKAGIAHQVVSVEQLQQRFARRT